MIVQCCENIDKEFEKNCPTVARSLKDAISQQKSDHILLSSKIKEIENFQGEMDDNFISKDNFKLFDFKVGNLIRELDFYKKHLTSERVEELLKVPRLVKDMDYKLGEMVRTLETKAFLTDVRDLEDKCSRDYATKMMIRDVERLCDTLCTKKEAEKLEVTIIALEDLARGFMTADGLDQKFKYLENQFRQKLADRPT